MFKSEKELPYSNKRYLLTTDGKILNADRSVVREKKINNKLYVNLAWYDGLKDYELGLVVCVAIFNIFTPVDTWNKIEVIYSDGNSCNVSVNNLAYRFKDGPLEVEGLPGFYYVPYYTRYALNKAGELYSLRKKHIKKWNVSKPVVRKNITGGYYVGGAHSDYWGTKTLSRHRAIGLVFLRYEKTPKKLVINHKNGVPGDDAVNNLEWCTYSENNKHAYDNGLFPNKVIPILVKQESTGQVHRFNTVSEAAQFFNLDLSLIYSRIKTHPGIFDSKGFAFKKDNGKEWPETKKRIKKKIEASPIISRNVITGDLRIFDSREEAGLYFGITPTTVSKHVDTERFLPVRNENFRYFPFYGKWPVHSEKHIKMYEANKTSGPLSAGIIVYNSNDEEIDFLTSFKELETKYNIKYSKFKRNYIKDNCKQHNGNYFVLFEPEKYRSPY